MISDAVIDAASQRAQFNIDRLTLLSTIAAKAVLKLEVRSEAIEYMTRYRHYDGPRLVTHLRMTGYVARPTLRKAELDVHDMRLPADYSLREAQSIVTQPMVLAAWARALKTESDEQLGIEIAGVVSSVELVDCCNQVVAFGTLTHRCIHWAKQEPLDAGEILELKARIARIREQSRIQRSAGQVADADYLLHLASHYQRNAAIAEARRYLVLK